MLWGTFLDPDGACSALASDLDAVCLEFGAQPDDREFRPHATLVRARSPKPVAQAALDEAARALVGVPNVVSVVSFTLFSSTLTREGAIYSVLRECRLGSA
jgi:2'-5' RNA ligase